MHHMGYTEIVIGRRVGIDRGRTEYSFPNVRYNL